jgi:hypothetical protein
VTVLADGITEPAETFLVKLSGATNATWNAEIVSRVGNRYTIGQRRGTAPSRPEPL